MPMRKYIGTSMTSQNRRKHAAAKALAIHRMVLTRRPLTNRSTRAPASGVKRITDRRWRESEPMRRRLPRDQKQREKGEQPEDGQQRVVLDEAGLHAAEQVA